MSEGGAPRWLKVYVALLVVFLFSPMALIVPVSFNRGATFDFPPSGLSVRWYVSLFQNADFGRAFLTSLVVAAVATILSLVVGGLAAYGLSRYRFPGRGLVTALALSPLVIPGIVLGVAMIMFFNTIGLLQSIPGLIVANVIVTLPYVVRTLTAALANLDPAVEEVAMVLGAGRLQVIWRVVVPSIAPGLVAAGVIAGLVAFDEFTIALFITGGDVVTLPVQIFQSTYYQIDPTVAAVSTLLLLFSGLVITAADRAVGFDRLFGISVRSDATAAEPGNERGDSTASALSATS
jgi:putative spermidine/putrescine transport system permease protein